MSVKIKDKDKGYKKRVRQLKAAGKGSVTVGIHSSDGGNAEANGATVLEVAIWNEFGTSRIPSRSFLRAWFDLNQEKAKREWQVLMKSVAKGQRTLEEALEVFGLRVVGEIQARIAAGIQPANAESTIARKGSDKPLIDTGVLRSSITHAVKTK